MVESLKEHSKAIRLLEDKTKTKNEPKLTKGKKKNGNNTK
jgi:hypothetical protein